MYALMLISSQTCRCQCCRDKTRLTSNSEVEMQAHTAAPYTILQSSILYAIVQVSKLQLRDQVSTV